jgi:hypothetical protein
VNRTVSILLVLVVAVGVFANETRDAEAKKIESLIASVSNLRGATFVRNGKAYDPATAAKFLRGKWDRQAREVVTAEDFIEKIATRSSTTGRIYVVRFPDGREVAVAAFLRAELQKTR